MKTTYIVATQADPFYAPGASWWTPYTDAALAHVGRQASALRAAGYTVTVEEETR